MFKSRAASHKSCGRDFRLDSCQRSYASIYKRTSILYRANLHAYFTDLSPGEDFHRHHTLGCQSDMSDNPSREEAPIFWGHGRCMNKGIMHDKKAGLIPVDKAHTPASNAR
ncbi:hypothetical protein E2C01_087340 [Portunus trituberculatus]|uniref:Uncharacterized protein n=1 Tax=Portunus trituberculatus TaxID=210409 RepID=A0A5B7J324_PORTR|nr:hypothetical protein [Portunus trituberculatus]